MPSRTSRTSARPALRAGALVVAGGLVLLAAAPGTAAGPVAQASATALEITVAGMPTDSGTYRVTHDGRRQTATGSNRPAIQVLAGQSNLSAGTLAQDATTSAVGDSGRSAACAGLAGDGATVAEAGGGSCLTPGDNLSIGAGNLDLSGLEIVRSDLLMGLDQQLQDALRPLLDAVLPAAEDGLEQALTSLGDLTVTLDLGAIQSRCTAGPDTADGDSQLVDTRLSVDVAGQQVDLVRLPVNPPPNTKLLTGLDTVVASITDALQTQLTTAFDGVLGPAGPLVDQLQTALEENVLATVAEQLAPLEENVLDGTLNKQVRPTRDSIEVTAVDVEVLPAARQFGVELLSVEIGRSTCGPSARVVPTREKPSPEPKPRPSVPTSIPAGLDGVTAAPTGDGSVNDRWASIALALLAVTAGGAGVAAYRRVVRG